MQNETNYKWNTITYSKFLPVVAGYRMDKRSFLLLSTIKTARHVNGIP